MTDPQRIPEELAQQATRGRKLLVITCDEDGNLEMEENTFAGWALSGVANWLELVAEASMNEEMADEAEGDPE